MRFVLRVWIPILAALVFMVAATPAATTKRTAKKTASSRKAPAKKTATKKASAKKASTRKTTRAGAAKKSSKSTSASRRSKSTSRRAKSSPRRSTWRTAGQRTPSESRLKEIQGALAEKGYFKGEADGKWGASSADAMKRFQEDQNIQPTGKIDSLSLIGLGLGPKYDQPSGAPTAPSSN